MDRSVAPPLGLTLSTCAMRVCARCFVWSLHHPHAAWSRYPTRHVFPRAARYTCPVHKCPIAGARACVRIRRRGSGAESPGDIERCSACGGHGHRVFRQQVATQPSVLPAGTGLTPWGTRLPHLHRDWARPSHICTGTVLAPVTSAHGTGLAPATSGRDHLDSALCAPVVRERCVCRTGRAGLLSAGRVSHTCAATVGSLPRWGTTDCRGAIESSRVPGSAMRWTYLRTRRPLTHHSFPPCCRPPAHLRRSHCGTNGSARCLRSITAHSHRCSRSARFAMGLARSFTGTVTSAAATRSVAAASAPRPPLPARAGALLCTSGSSCEDGRIGAIRSCRRPCEHATDGWARARSCSQYSRSGFGHRLGPGRATCVPSS